MDDTSFQYTRVLALISWSGLNEITERDVLEKEYISCRPGHSLSFFLSSDVLYFVIHFHSPILSFVYAKRSTEGSPRNIMPVSRLSHASSSYNLFLRVEKINALVSGIYI